MTIPLKMIRWILCRIGLHHWKPSRFSGRLFPLNGSDPGRSFFCERCRKSKWEPSL